MRLRAVLLILVAAAALLVAAAAVGFYLLSDPERVRNTAEASLGRALGQEVRLEGPIGLRFLPRPEAVIMQPRVVTRLDGRILASADRIDLAISPVALLTGEEPVARLTVVRPQMSEPLAPLDLLLLAKGSGVGSISIADGAVELDMVPGAPPLRLSGMSLERSRDEAGNTAVTVSAVSDQGPLTLTAQLRRPDGSGGVPGDIDLHIGGDDAGLAAHWQGLFAEARLFGQIQVEASRRLPAWLGTYAMLAPDAPWHATAKLDFSVSAFQVSELVGTAGEAELTGGLNLDRASGRGSAQVDVRGAALDAPPSEAATFVLQDLPGYRVDLRMTGRDLSVQGVAVPNLEADATLEETGRIAVERVVASIAGDGAFRLEDGQFSTDPQPTLRGRVSLDLPTARPVLGQWGGLPDWLAADKPGALLIEGDLGWSEQRLDLADAAIRSDQSSYRGHLLLQGSELTVDGSIDRLDLSEWGSGGLDLPKMLALLPDGQANLKIGRLSRRDNWIENVQIEASRHQGRLSIAEASAGDPNDLHLTLAGSVEPEAKALDLVVGLDAQRPARLTALLGLDLPWLTRLDGLDGTAALKGPIGRLDVTVDASSGERHASLAGTLGTGGAASATDLHLQADAPDLAMLLSDLALLPITPEALRGRLAATADLGRAADGRWQARMDVRAGPLQGQAQLDLRMGGEHPRLAGQIALGPIEPAALHSLYDFLATTLAFAPGSPLRWPGQWPAMDLAWAWLFDTELDLSLRREDGEGRSGLGRIRLENGKLDLERLDLALPDGGRLNGDATLDGGGDVPLFGAAITLDGLDAATVGGWFDMVRPPNAKFDAEIDLAGKGKSISAIVGDLEGSVRIAIGPGAVPPPAGSETPPFAFTGITGQLDVHRGILATPPPHLAVDLPDRTRRYLAATLDLPVWFFDGRLLPEADGAGLHILGPPSLLQTVPISPTDPASVPDGPGDRTPLPSTDPAPATLP